MSQQNQGNKQSENGEARHVDRGQPKTVSSISGSKADRNTVGSSDGNGIRFPIHNHPDKSVMTKGKLPQ